MKKKLIEQMKDPRITKGMEGVVAIARIPAAGLLTIDFVDTDTKEVECRHCVTKNEFANYYPDTGIWDNKRLNNANEYERNYMFAKVYGASNIKKAGIGIKGDSLTSIDWHEYMVTQDKRTKAEHRKAVQCNERNEKVPEPTEEEMQFLTRYIDGHRIIYYKRKGKYVDIACSECGHHGRYIMSRFMNCFEDVARPYLDFVPEHNMGGEQCPKCGTYAIWKAAGRARVTQTKEDHRSLISVIDGNVVVRSFLLQKDIFGDEKAASFRTYYTEQSRVWFLDDRVQKDYFKYSGYTGREYWDYCNLAGNRSIQIKVGKTYRGNLDCLKETKFKYSQLDVELARNDYLNVIDYLECYLRYPMLEMLEKLGMTRLKKYLIENFRWTELIRNGYDLVKRPEYLLKVTKQRFNDLRIKNGSVELLKLYQMEQKKETDGTRFRFTEEQTDFILNNHIKISDVETLLSVGILQKGFNYVNEKMEDENYRLGVRVNDRMANYVDYLKMLVMNGRSLTEHELYPRNYIEAHNRELLMQDKAKKDKEREEKNAKNKNIKKDAPEYNRRYKYQTSEYIIRAPKDAGEILDEGFILNHCVGRAGYIEAMNRHETVFLFLRRKKEKKEPYYTLEVKNNKIVQAYGNSDTKPDWDVIGPLLDAFAEDKLKEKKIQQKVG